MLCSQVIANVIASEIFLSEARHDPCYNMHLKMSVSDLWATVLLYLSIHCILSSVSFVRKRGKKGSLRQCVRKQGFKLPLQNDRYGKCLFTTKQNGRTTCKYAVRTQVQRSMPPMFHGDLAPFWNTGSCNGSGESSNCERR